MSTQYTTSVGSIGNDMFKKVVRHVFDSTERDAIIESNRLYISEATDDLFERMMRFAGLPSGVEVPEGGEIQNYSPKFNKTLDIKQKTYGLGFRVSWLMKRTNKWDMVQRWTRSLRLKQAELKDVELAKLWNAPTSTDYVGYDTLALGSASHTCLDDAASTYDNLISVALSTTGLESAKYYFETLKDDQGAACFAKPDTLYHAPALEFVAWELVKSSGKAHELSNTANYWQNKWDPFMYHRLTSATAWGLVARNDDRYDVRCYTLSEPDMVDRDAPNQSRDTIVDSLQAFNWGFGSPMMVCIGNT